jgi:predicted membrane protein
MLLGGYFLVNNLGILSLNITGELVFPILILLFGLSLLIDALRKPKKPSISFSHCNDKSNKAHSTFFEENEHFECSVSFCENTHIVTLPRLSSGDASVSFGELTLDLTQCEEIADDCELEVSCSFGELVLVVPKTCRVISDSSTSFGSLEFSCHPDTDAQAVIRLDGSVSFGSIEIRYL